MTALQQADAALAAGAPLLRISEPTLLLHSSALRALGAEVRDRDALDASRVRVGFVAGREEAGVRGDQPRGMSELLLSAMIFTTNKPLAAWGQVLHDEDLAQAFIDRVLERGRLLRLDGPSLRTKNLGLDDPLSTEAGSSEVVKISGNQCSEIPEPTPPNVLGGSPPCFQGDLYL